MLKGQLDIDVEFMGGTIIFVVFAIILFLEVMVPLFAVQHASSEANRNVVGMEYSNFAKSRLISYAGDGGGAISHAKLSSVAASGPAAAGVGGGYLSVTDILGERKWEFDGERNPEASHTSFAAMSADFIPASGSSVVVMRVGKDYVVSAYGAGGTVMLDVYADVTCGAGAANPDSVGFWPLGCGELSQLEPLSLDADGLSDAYVVPVKNGVTGRNVLIVSASSDMKAKDLVPAGLGLAEPGECVPGKAGLMCVRLAGRYTLPVGIYAEATGGVFTHSPGTGGESEGAQGSR